MHYLGTRIVVRDHPCCKSFLPLITKFPIPNLAKDNIQTFFLAKILNHSLVYF